MLTFANIKNGRGKKWERRTLRINKHPLVNYLVQQEGEVSNVGEQPHESERIKGDGACQSLNKLTSIALSLATQLATVNTTLER